MVNVTPRPLYRRERPHTHFIGSWVRPMTGLDWCEKSRPHRDSIPGPSSPTKSIYGLHYPGPLSGTEPLSKSNCLYSAKLTTANFLKGLHNRGMVVTSWVDWVRFPVITENFPNVNVLILAQMAFQCHVHTYWARRAVCRRIKKTERAAASSLSILNV